MAEEKTVDKAGAEKAAEETEPSINVVEAESANKSSTPLWDLEGDFERAFEKFFNRDWLRTPRFGFPALRESAAEKMPSVNIIDRDDELVVEAELPNVKKEDLEISLSDNTVSIKATTRKEEKEEKGDYRRQEISTRSYSRVLPLPAAIESDKARAELKDGLLTLTLPKSEQAKRVRVEID